MKRRRFLGVASALVAPALVGMRGRRAPDLVLRRAVVFDGTLRPGQILDIAVTGDRITAMGRVLESGIEEIDLAGLALAPGFIDIHSHADLSLLVNPRAESRIRQGVTLEVVGQDGSSIGPWGEAQARATSERYRSDFGIDIDIRDLSGLFNALEQSPAAVNLASMVGHGTVRGTVMGFEDRSPTPRELARMRELVATALQQGAVGFSSGLEYTPGAFATPDELVALAGEFAGSGYPYASHMRNEDDRLLAAIEETLHVGRQAGVPVQISHLKAQGERNWWKTDVVFEAIDRARADGLEVHFDRYPYIAYATGLSNLFPTWVRAGGTEAFLGRLRDEDLRPRIEEAVRAKIGLLGSWDAVQISSVATSRNAALRGRRLGEIAAEAGEDPFDLTLRLMAEERAGVGMIGFGMSAENTQRILAHPAGMIASDGGSFAPYGPLSGGSPHPRSYGTFPRVLGHYVRELRAIPIEVAIHKMTGLPAQKLRLRDRGVLRVGAFADLVAFDPGTVSDTATFSNPHSYPTGIPLVVVNGVVTLREGEQSGRLAGRPVRGTGAPSR